MIAAARGSPGSSPLTRGKQKADAEALKQFGLIPAHAGKTRSSTRLSRRMGAHPRSRGENWRRVTVVRSILGSSPLTRGKPVREDHDGVRPGLIPAHAGKTFQAELEMIQERAHPRSRGENGGPVTRRGLHPGSSPLTRGKHTGLAVEHPEDGLIPAHAGKTCARWRTRTRQRAHPRSRGENPDLLGRSPDGQGSSPLTRGKRTHRGRESQGVRLIPAHAGKTSIGCVPLTIPWAHPRSRGENFPGRAGDDPGAGSSPLTRGKPRVRDCATPDRGLIPAHAGKTL